MEQVHFRHDCNLALVTSSLKRQSPNTNLKSSGHSISPSSDHLAMLVEQAQNRIETCINVAGTGFIHQNRQHSFGIPSTPRVPSV